MLKVGELVRVESRVWRVGLVNPSRARLDPISGFEVADPTSGRSGRHYGDPINIGPDAAVERVDPATLTGMEKLRLKRLLEAAEQQTQSQGQSNVAAMPMATKSRAQLEADRKATLQAKKDARAASRALDAANRSAAGQGSAKSKVKDKFCKCGCGQPTASWFWPGHDARFKGWLLKIERGQVKKEDVLTPEVIAEYTWVSNGTGEVPTLNYKGEPHSGYEVV